MSHILMRFEILASLTYSYNMISVFPQKMMTSLELKLPFFLFLYLGASFQGTAWIFVN